MVRVTLLLKIVYAYLDLQIFMHSKQVLEYIFFEANLSSKNVPKPIVSAQSGESGIQYTDECVDLPSSIKSMEKESNLTETLLGMPHAEFR